VNMFVLFDLNAHDMILNEGRIEGAGSRKVKTSGSSEPPKRVTEILDLFVFDPLIFLPSSLLKVIFKNSFLMDHTRLRSGVRS